MDKIFVFTQINRTGNSRPYLLAIPEKKINSIESQMGSENVYLKVNGIEVEGSFNYLVSFFGDRMDITSKDMK